jgi:hypothetical protein
MKEEAARNGQEFDLNDEEARELFQMTMAEFMSEEIGDSVDADTFQTEQTDNNMSDDFDTFLAGMKREASDRGLSFDFVEAEVREFFHAMKDSNDNFIDAEEDVSLSTELNESVENDSDSFQTRMAGDNEESSLLPILSSLEEGAVAIAADTTVGTTLNPRLAGLSESQIAKVEELQMALPGLPIGRAKRIVRTFEGTLGMPSMLALVPHLRETMPDRVTSGWLKRINMSNAEIAMRKAIEDDIVDTSLLNAMLEVKCSSGSIDEALACHDDFEAHKRMPTAYSDRLVLQMLVASNRPSRALKFKQDVETAGRTLDIASYGSLVQYYSRHNQLGPSLMLLRECLSVHGAPPSEFYLSQLRVLCRQNDAEDEVQLQRMIGEEPIAWLKHGERFLKREKSKKGNRDIQRAYNRALA